MQSYSNIKKKVLIENSMELLIVYAMMLHEIYYINKVLFKVITGNIIQIRRVSLIDWNFFRKASVQNLTSNKEWTVGPYTLYNNKDKEKSNFLVKTFHMAKQYARNKRQECKWKSKEKTCQNDLGLNSSANSKFINEKRNKTEKSL